ncbi:MAG: acyl-CoA synthetase [Bacteroidota bacterium]
MAKLSTWNEIEAFEQLPLPAMPVNVYEALQESANRYPNRIALSFFMQTKSFRKPFEWSFADLLQEVNATANMFAALGVGPQDVVTYILPNSPETIFSFYGGETAGIVNAINPLLEASQMAEIMNAAGTKVLVTMPPFPQTDIWEKVSSILDAVPSLETVLTIDLSRYLGFLPRQLIQLTQSRAKVGEGVQIMDFYEARKDHDHKQLSFQRTIKAEDVASYFHTGGTTGRPKIAQRTHRNEVFNAWLIDHILELDGYKRFFCGLPWFHANGVIITGLLPLIGGNGIVLGTPSGYRGPGVLQNFWKIVEHYELSFFSAVPTVLQRLLDIPTKGAKLDSLEYAFCGAAPLSVKLFEDFEATTGLRILEGYGFTEGACVNSANPSFGERKIGSVGLPVAHHHLNIVHLDEEGEYLRDAETDEIGHIVARGENVFVGYKEAEHNQGIWIDDGTHRWYKTGDLGRKDADGYYWITGRQKELIIRGGHNIDPKSIEEPMAKHPAVAMVAAVGRPDPELGEKVALYVQPKKGQQIEVGDLMNFARQHIPERAAIPQVIEIMEQLPLTAIGKVYKLALHQMQIEAVFRGRLTQILGQDEFALEVVQHPYKGLLVQIKVSVPQQEWEARIDQALGGYTVPYEVVFG